MYIYISVSMSFMCVFVACTYEGICKRLHKTFCQFCVGHGGSSIYVYIYIYIYIYTNSAAKTTPGSGNRQQWLLPPSGHTVQPFHVLVCDL